MKTKQTITILDSEDFGRYAKDRQNTVGNLSGCFVDENTMGATSQNIVAQNIMGSSSQNESTNESIIDLTTEDVKFQTITSSIEEVIFHNVLSFVMSGSQLTCSDRNVRQQCFFLCVDSQLMKSNGSSVVNRYIRKVLLAYVPVTLLLLILHVSKSSITIKFF